ncbi:hypothetical protein [Rummeliibacillus sp. SL167]|uniref:hypothetical protein n=1 Tax=Rummeliibacillus sp. SL167 TaxID=2579792 RepID=UPI0011B785C7|nr:hypothetical protein [Rummeliibacillus sp. SL167]
MKSYQKFFAYLLSASVIFAMPTMAQAAESGDTTGGSASDSSLQENNALEETAIDQNLNDFNNLEDSNNLDEQTAVEENQQDSETSQEATLVTTESSETAKENEIQSNKDEALSTAIAESNETVKENEVQSNNNDAITSASDINAESNPKIDEQELANKQSSKEEGVLVAANQPEQESVVVQNVRKQLPLSIRLLGDSNSSQSSKGLASNLLSIGLNLPVIGNISLNLLSTSTIVSKTGHTYVVPTGLLGIGITNSLLLGNLNLGILAGSIQDNNNFQGGIVTLDTDNLLGKTHLGIIENHKSTTNDEQSFRTGLLLGDLKDTLLGDAHIGVAELNTHTTAESNSVQSGLLLGDLHNSLLGDQHVGVGEYRQTETADSKETTAGLILVDSENTPVGDYHVGVGEYHQTETADGKEITTGLIIVDSKDSSDGDDQAGEEEPDQSQPDEEKPDQPQVDDSSDKNDEGVTNDNGKTSDLPTTSTEPTNTVPPTINPDGNDKSENVTEPFLDGPDASGQNASSQNASSQDLVASTKDLSSGVSEKVENQKESTLVQTIKELIKAGNSTILNEEIAGLYDKDVQNIFTKDNQANNSLAVTSYSSTTVSSGGPSSGPGAASSSVSNSDSIPSYLSSERFNLEVENYLGSSIVKKLADQWKGDPLIEPPKSSFFLSA